MATRWPRDGRSSRQPPRRPEYDDAAGPRPEACEVRLLADREAAALHARRVCRTTGAVGVLDTFGDARIAERAGARAERRACLAGGAAFVLIAVVSHDLDAIGMAGDQADLEAQLGAVVLLAGSHHARRDRISRRGQVPFVRGRVGRG